MVETEAVHAANWAVGTKEAAELLGVSTARLRQLNGTNGFPLPAASPAGGPVYRADEIETYAAHRVIGKGGRPRNEP